MKKTYGTNSLITDREAEEEWERENAVRTAETEFARARHRGMRRALLALLRKPRLAPCSALREGIAFALPIDEVAGILRSDGEVRTGLPPLRRMLLPSWGSAYARIDPESYEPFALRFLCGAWYLDGGDEALLKLEILRAKGEPTIIARLSGQGKAAVPESPSCCAVAC